MANSGVMTCPIDWTTTQGYDMQFGTNVIGKDDLGLNHSNINGVFCQGTSTSQSSSSQPSWTQRRRIPVDTPGWFTSRQVPRISRTALISIRSRMGQPESRWERDCFTLRANW